MSEQEQGGAERETREESANGKLDRRKTCGEWNKINVRWVNVVTKSFGCLVAELYLGCINPEHLVADKCGCNVSSNIHCQRPICTTKLLNRRMRVRVGVA